MPAWVCGLPGDDGFDREPSRWPRWASILFVLGSSVLLWLLIVAVVWWFVGSD